MNERIKENLYRVKANIAEACARVGRNPANVTLIAVTKDAEPTVIRSLMDLDHEHFGESKPQELTRRNALICEAMQRRIELPGLMADPRPVIRPKWHMIGHLQRNKVKAILPVVDYIHSVDSLRLAEEINTAAARLGLEKKVKILLQVNTSEEPQKQGLAVGALIPLAEQIKTLPNIQVCGLMTMAALSDNPENSRFCFGRLRELFEEMKGERITGPEFRHISMGMSQDYQVAIEEGATMVRVGTALFGERKPQPEI
ncbi:MAG: YggS family pyridoxal phosphate-dependent enzyme [Sedimentisphaerales bacterium]|nr:YggS family pyridoxal phosphate-dependent enzyme [Sedimentisphaerales bacterium]MBN2844116.1 YggS family pyridoxal phosphate-dependent enzyme [Sedimentisphaerales bacterium]